jgi:protein-disulfide isomerase
MSKKAWLIFVAVVVLLLGSLVYLSNKSKVTIDVSAINTANVLPASEQSGNIADHVFGKTDSKVIFTEYGDFQCPGCGGMHPTVKALTEKYEGQLTFVFRNFPITTAHPNARAAAAAAEAAGLQGKYWEMHNKLFEGQDSWQDLKVAQRTDFFVGYARELGLSEDKFKTDLASTSVGQKISFDQALARKDKVNSTPTFYLNGQQIPQATWGDQAKLEKAITDALKAEGIALPSAE